MEQASFCLFETPLGPCGIAWQEAATPGLGSVVTFMPPDGASRHDLFSHLRPARLRGDRMPFEG